MVAKVVALYRYPVKGFTPQGVEHITVLPGGRVAGDRVLNFFCWRVVYEPLHFIMERKMLLGIKERAERACRARTTVPPAVRMRRLSSSSCDRTNRSSNGPKRSKTSRRKAPQ